MTTQLTQIVIPASEAEADNEWQAGAWASQLIQVAINEAGYELDELPEDAVRFDDLWDYLARQSNSGHALISDEPEDSLGSWRRAAQLLDDLGFTGHRALLEDFAAFSIDKRDRMAKLYAEGEEMAAGDLFQPFDDRFRALRPSLKDLRYRLRDWLLQRPWTKVSSTAEPATAAWMRGLVPRHPLAEQRLAARKRQRVAEHHGEMVAFKKRLLDRLDRKTLK